MIFIATAKQGELDFGSDYNEQRLKSFLLDNEGKTFRLEKVAPKRSLPQNAFYWLYLGIISRETGDDENSLHEYFKRALLPPKWLKVRGKEIRVPSSTTELTKTEMSDYMDKICAETNVPIPDPKELEKLGYIMC